MRINKRTLYVSVAAAVLTIGNGAHAQDAGTGSADPQTTSASSADIIVTAQRRSQKLTDVPASVSVISEATLQSQDVVDVLDLGRVVSGLNVTTSGNYFQPTLRGVGTNINNSGAAENTVAIYIDGFYQPSITSRPTFSNIERIEVLKGPQGTLFGRNATGGAILITTKDPSFDPGMELSVTAATYDDYRGDLYLTTGITDTIAANIYASGRSANGYVEDLATGEPWTKVLEYSLRGKVLFEPSDKFRTVLSVNYGLSKDATGYARVAQNGSTSGRNLPDFTPDSITTERGKTTQNFKPLGDNEVLGVNLKMSYDLGFATLNSLSQYDWEKNDSAFDSDLTYASAIFDLGPWRTTSELLAQDINLTRESGPLTWVAGFYYFNRDAGTPFLLTPSFPVYSYMTFTRAYAFYADATYDITDKLALTVGGRYSHERQRVEERRVQNGPIILEHDPETFSDFTPRVALRYEITPGQSVYASYSQGFKSGLIARTQTEPVKPEEVVAYEVGYKLGRDNIRLDLAAFWYDYTNLQATAFRSGVNSAQIFNAADATIKGLEGTLYFSPVDVIGFNANATYLDAKYDNFPNAISQIPKPDLTGSTLVSPVDVSGNKIIRTPEFSANVGVDLHPPVSSGNLTLSMSYSYSSRVYWGFDNANSQKPWGLLNASVNWTSDDERYSVTLFGTNITDEKYFSGVVESAAINWANYGNPAVFGVKLGTKW